MERIIKIVLVGDSGIIFLKIIIIIKGVGKTSIVERYIKKTYSSKIESTIGSSFFEKKIYYEDLTYKL